MPAFLFGPVGFFYRKMWLIAGFIMLALIGISSISAANRAGLPVAIMLGLTAYRTSVQHAIAALQKLCRPDSTIDPVALVQVGGVSRRAGWISGIIYAALLRWRCWASSC